MCKEMASTNVLYSSTAPADSRSNSAQSFCVDIADSPWNGSEVGDIPDDCNVRSMSTESLQVSASSLPLESLPSITFTGTEKAESIASSVDLNPVDVVSPLTPTALLSTAKKTVRFACSSTDKVNFVLSRKQLSYKERNKTWWTQADFDYLRRVQREITNAAVRTSSGRVLSNAFQLESVEDEQRVIDANSDEDGKVIQGLIAWYQEDLGRRGLERLCCQQHKKERLKARQRAVSYVLKNQHVDSKEDFANGYEKLTRSAKKFALTMAQVDEFVAHDRFISTNISDSMASSVSSPHPPSSKRESPPSSPASSTSSLTSITLSSVSSTVPLPSQTKGIVNAKNCSVPILITRNNALLQVKPRRSVTVLTRLPTGMVIVSQEQKAAE